MLGTSGLLAVRERNVLGGFSIRLDQDGRIDRGPGHQISQGWVQGLRGSVAKWPMDCAHCQAQMRWG